MDAYANDGGFSDDGSLSTSCAATFGVNDGCGGSDGGGSDAGGGGGGGGGGGSQSGYVQDVSPFDRILLAAWEDRFAAGLFRYDVTACDTKIIPGRIGFVAQYNEGRATKKRPTEFKVDQVCQEFDAGKFNFTKADKAEILFRFSPGGVGQTRSEYVASAPIEYADADRVRGESDAPTVVFINVSPIEYGHVLLTPRVTDCLPQRISKDALLPALFMAAESRNPYFRVGYNSLGAYATINHLHFQAYYLMEAFPIERAPTRALGLHVHAEGGALSSGVVVKNVVDYPARCLCFERADPSRGSDGFESLAASLAVCCERLQARDVPFNLLVADHGARVFLIPNQFSQRAAKGALPADVVATGVNPAVFEISGHLLYKQREDFETCDEASATRLLSCASLSEEDYDAACADVLALLDAAEVRSMHWFPYDPVAVVNADP
jgi:GDP-L-galactose phosphorylase